VRNEIMQIELNYLLARSLSNILHCYSEAHQHR
jgi:hypothetical protein